MVRRSRMLLFAVGLVAACGSDPPGSPAGDPSTASAGGGGSPAGAGGAGGELDLESTAAGAPPPACANQTVEAVLEERPVDIIVLADTSNVATVAQVAGVESGLNTLGALLAGSDVDYRVVLLTGQGTSAGVPTQTNAGVCVGPPLGLGACAPGQDNSLPPRFYHYAAPVLGQMALCDLLDWFAVDAGELTAAEADPNRMPGPVPGYAPLLRAGARKVILNFGYTDVLCALGDGATFHSYDYVHGTSTGADWAGPNRPPDEVAAAFDERLLALSPEHFGTAEQRNYVFHSIVGLAPPVGAGTYGAAEPLVDAGCQTDGYVQLPGQTYQALSRLTGGLRAPVCDPGTFAGIFTEIATKTIESRIPCSVPIPAAPAGDTVDLDTLVVGTASDGGAGTEFTRVADAAACAPGAYYLADDTIQLCPATCAALAGESELSLSIRFDCVQEVD